MRKLSKSRKSIQMNHNLDSKKFRQSIKCVIVIPAYREFLALPHLLLDLSRSLRSCDIVVICDDTDDIDKNRIVESCEKALENSKGFLAFSMSNVKSGRGGAVRRGMEFAISNFPNIESVIECDADSSHRPVDIIKLRDNPAQVDLLIGSRYLPESKIIGWPLTRRIFSWLLNVLIPRVLKMDLSDITNGLRRYSPSALNAILSYPAQNSGFIYLSEQAIVVKQQTLSIDEVPTVFINRQEGKSTVGWKEISSSLIGVMKLLSSQSRLIQK